MAKKSIYFFHILLLFIYIVYFYLVSGPFFVYDMVRKRGAAYEKNTNYFPQADDPVQSSDH